MHGPVSIVGISEKVEQVLNAKISGWHGIVGTVWVLALLEQKNKVYTPRDPVTDLPE